ncbi:hypothetical protein CYY_007150 [Polysphondylium violaceum]|uniref:glutaminase n=1 Tax=Polysphondylium violaceum TaxID=133409 RepID=A0A8J4PS97_9MYCE|nr:hypothetical protein CYY_007150 [Polysphondylium violaceum]
MNSNSNSNNNNNNKNNNEKSLNIAVLSLQGGFKEHVDMIHSLANEYKGIVDLNVKEIRSYEQMKEFKPDGVILPGGESTSMSIIASSHSTSKSENIFEYLRQYVESGNPIWGTCAGSIMLSNQVEGQKEGGQSLIGGLDTLISRNYFGRQINSFIKKVDLKLIGDNHDSVDESERSTSILHDFEAVFIRAPAILKVLDSDKVSIICEIDVDLPKHRVNSSPSSSTITTEKIIIGVRQSNILATVFHPELTNDNRFHKYFIDIVLKHKLLNNSNNNNNNK